MTARRPTRSRPQLDNALSLALGGAAMVFVVWVWLQAPPSGPLLWLPALVWIALYTSARLTIITLLGGDFSFGHIFLLAAFLSLGFPLAMAIGSIGIVLEQLARSLLHARLGLKARSISATLGAIGRALAYTFFSLGIAVLAFQVVGGRAPLADDQSLADAVPLITLLVVYALAAMLIRAAFPARGPSAWLRAGPSASLRARLRAGRRAPLRQNIRQGMLLDLLPLPLSLVIAAHYLRADFGLFVVFAISLMVFMALLLRADAAQATLAQRTRERASISAIGQAIVSSLDLPELLDAIHRHISPLMDARNFYVALYNEDYDELSFPLVYEDGQTTRYRSRSAGNGLTEYVLRTRTPLLIPSDVPGAIKRLGLEVVPGKEARSWLGVPITIGDRALGVITVQSHDQSNAYRADDVELLSTIASHAAVAIENAQLYASTRRRAAELAILNSVSTAVGSSLNLDQVMEAIVSSVGPVVGCQKAAILLVQESGRNFAPAAWRGLSRAFLEQMPALMRAARGDGATASVERQLLIVNNVRSDPRFEKFRAIAETEGIRAFADVPLQARDHVIGTLTVCYTEPHRFTVAELDLLTTFANQAAAAVSNAALHAQTDLALARRIEELAALEEIGRELTGTLDFNRVIERVLDAAIEFAGASRGLVALYDPDRHTLNLVAARGYPAGALADTMIEHWPADQGIIGTAIRDRMATWIEDVHDPSSFDSRSGGSGLVLSAVEGQAYIAIDPAIRSALVVPILRDGQPLGVVNLESTRRAAFNQASASFIGQLATQAAVAIRNAQLHQQTQNRLRETSILFELSQQVTSILDLPELGRELANQLARALGTTHCRLELVTHDADQLERIADYVSPGCDPIPLDVPQEPAGVMRQLSIDTLQRSRQPVIIYATDAPGHPADYEFLREQKLFALIGLPLIAGNAIIGRIIWMHSHHRAPFSADEIRFAQTLANQASIAVQNARLFHERARRVNDLSQLYQASLALASSIELDEALGRIALIAREITDSGAVTVYLYDARADRITHGSHLAGADQLFDASAIRPRGMIRQVIAARQPVLVNDTWQEPDTSLRVLEAGIRSMIAMPIMRKDQVLGVLYLNSQTPGKYSADSLQLVQLLANEAAVAIENTRLFSDIAEARDRLAAILDSSRDGVLMFDLSGRIIVANPMLEQLWDIPRAELEGESLLRLLDAPERDLPARLGYPPDTLRGLLEQATAGVQAQWGKDTFTLPGGARPRSIERTGLPVLDEHGGLVGWMLVLRDVTEEQELQMMREDLSNMIIHDLRSPLVAILDSYDLIVEVMPPQVTSNVVGPALDIGKRSSRKLLDLVNSLLDISRFEHGQVLLDTQFAALRPLAENALEQLAPMVGDRGLLARNDVPPDLPLVRVDEDQITRVLINLIDNAVKFSPAGGQVVISARPGPNGADGSAQTIVCSVRDMGPGIPPEYRDRIFERFIQVTEGLERRRGTGLGLAFCKMAIEAHGGSIWVEDSPDGQGSQFSFTLPVADLPPSL